MTGKKVSVQQTRTMTAFLAEPESWFDCTAVERKTGLPGSSVRHFLFSFFKLGLLERVDVYGGYRYRLSPTAQAQPYFQRLKEAAAVMQT
jgi:DNA-binding IclR family transcriptional regulator